jgi:flagellar motor protein MotB
VYIASFADNQPRSTTDLQQNRRVEIVVLPPLTPAAGG